jgi:hypothetical protein
MLSPSHSLPSPDVSVKVVSGAVGKEKVHFKAPKADRLMKARLVFAERMGNIGGIWTAACHCEMKIETSSNGMVS